VAAADVLLVDDLAAERALPDRLRRQEVEALGERRRVAGVLDAQVAAAAVEEFAYTPLERLLNAVHVSRELMTAPVIERSLAHLPDSLGVLAGGVDAVQGRDDGELEVLGGGVRARAGKTLGDVAVKAARERGEAVGTEEAT
jgi:hypothetical protein